MPADPTTSSVGTLVPPPSRLSGVRSWVNTRSADVAFAPRWLWAVVAVVVTFGVHAYVAWEHLGPALAADEVSTVGAAHVIAHGTTDWVLAGSGYMPGTALLLAPAWWFTDDPFTVYHVGLALGVLLAVATIAPLAAIARELGIASRAGAVTIAAVVMLAPARTVPTNYVASEQLLTLVTAALIAYSFRAARARNARSLAVLGVFAGLVFLAHGRGIAVTLGACLWVLVIAWRKWGAIASFAVAVGLTTGLAWLLYRWVSTQLYWSDNRVGQTFNGLGEHTFSELVGTIFGQGWYLLAAWPAVGILGIAVAIRRLRLRAGESLLIAALVPTLVLALIQLDKSTHVPGLFRLDPWIYGRYVDHLYTIAAVMGLALLARVRARIVPVTLAIASAVIGLGFLAITVPQIPPGGSWAHFHVGGVVYMLSEANYLSSQPEPWLLLTFAAWMISAIVVVAAYRRAAPLVLALLFTALSVAADAGIVDSHDEPKRITKALADPFEGVAIDEPAAFDINYGLGINAFAFALDPRQVVPVTVAEASENYVTVYTAFLDDTPYDYGALPYDGPSYYNFWLWYFPGPEFDALEARGMLVHPTTESD